MFQKFFFISVHYITYGHLHLYIYNYLTYRDLNISYEFSDIMERRNLQATIYVGNAIYYVNENSESVMLPLEVRIRKKKCDAHDTISS